jgi:hypothetical protein
MEGANTLAYYNSATITVEKSFIVQSPGVHLIKLFVIILLTQFCKLDHSINANNICLNVVKRYSLQKE